MPFRRSTATAAVLVVAGAALVGTLGRPASSAPVPTVASTLAPATAAVTGPPRAPAAPAPPRRDDRPPRAPQGPLGSADGAVPEGTTVFDDDVPAVARLDPALLDALRRAATDARDGGVAFSVTSGWRSRSYQAQLLREAVATYGSAEEAARWVATPDTSAHVSGDAVDLGTDAAAWLARHGARYGLCRTYGNEPWHVELRPDAVDRGCPAPYPDPTHDPRMQER